MKALNWLLLFVPIAIALEFLAPERHLLIFFASSLAILPSTGWMGRALVPRLNQPGGNITGFANYEATMSSKYLELLSEIVPGLKRAAIMFNPGHAGPVSTFMPSFETARTT